LTESAKKHYEPLQWNNFFDELTYTDDVFDGLLREHQYSELDRAVLYFFAFTVPDTQQ
jgi:hypothetical protein